jgi:hypothetical protein
VARPLREARLPVEAVRAEEALDEGDAAARPRGAAGAGDRVDDDDDGAGPAGIRGQIRSKPRMSSQSVTAWSNACCSSRAVWR